MKVKLNAYGIARDIFHANNVDLELPDDICIKDLKVVLEHEYPDLGRLSSYRIAVNKELAGDGNPIHAGDELALIPPVSGG